MTNNAEKDAVAVVLSQHGQVLLNTGDLCCACGLRPWTRGLTGMEHTRHVAKVLGSLIADAWDAGYEDGYAHACATNAEWPNGPTNPYRTSVISLAKAEEEL